MKTVVRMILLCTLMASVLVPTPAQSRDRSNMPAKLINASGDWKFPAPGMKAKQDTAGSTTYLLGKDAQGRSYYATPIKSDGRDAVMVRMPDNLYTKVTKHAEGDAPDYILASIAFNYACHPKGENPTDSYVGSMHPEYRFLTRSGRAAHVITGQDKTVVLIWIESPAQSKRTKRR